MGIKAEFQMTMLFIYMISMLEAYHTDYYRMYYFEQVNSTGCNGRDSCNYLLFTHNIKEDSVLVIGSWDMVLFSSRK